MKVARDLHGPEVRSIPFIHFEAFRLRGLRRAEPQPVSNPDIVQDLKQPFHLVDVQLESIPALMLAKSLRFIQKLFQFLFVFKFLRTERVLEQLLVNLHLNGLRSFAQGLVVGSDQRVGLQKIEQHMLFALADMKNKLVRFRLDQFHLIALHRGVQTIFLELVHIMFGLFQALPSQNTLALVMDLQHVKF